MGVETLLVAVGGEDDTNTDDLIAAVRTFGTPETTVVLAHAFEEDTYERAREELGDDRRDAEDVGERGGGGAAGAGWVTATPVEWHDTVFGTPPARTDESDVAPEHEAENRAERLEATGPDEVAAQYDRIKAVADALEAEDVAYEIRGDVGDPADTILAVAREVDADAVAVGRRDRSSVGQALFGSVSEDVIDGADRPVVVV